MGWRRAKDKMILSYKHTPSRAAEHVMSCYIRQVGTAQEKDQAHKLL